MQDQPDERDGQWVSLLRDYRSYLQRQQAQLYEQVREFGKGFDQTLVTLAAGAIAGSVTFVEKVTSQGFFFLTVAWICLGASLLCILLSFQAAVVSLNKLYHAGATEELDTIRAEIAIIGKCHGDLEKLLAEKKTLAQHDKSSFASVVLHWMNGSAIALLMGGVIALLFAVTNLR
jgi:hypothetical protein